MERWTFEEASMCRISSGSDLHPATRFIATMNYGYAGTKELNEALVSRFVVIRMPMISQEHLILLLQDHYPTSKTEGAKELAAVYLDLQKKCENAQISSRAMDLRGLLDGVALMEKAIERTGCAGHGNYQ